MQQILFQGVEICFEMYDPTIHKIDVLRLEKRLDDELLYLRDALPEYSTFDPNMQPEILSEGEKVFTYLSTHFSNLDYFDIQ